MAATGMLAPSDGSPTSVCQGEITLFKHDSEDQRISRVLDRSEHIFICKLAGIVSHLDQRFSTSTLPTLKADYHYNHGVA